MKSRRVYKAPEAVHQHSEEAPQKCHMLCVVSYMHMMHSIVVQYMLYVSLCIVVASILLNKQSDS